MRMLLAPLLLLGLLSGCGDRQTATLPASWSGSTSLVYAYPYEGQTRIAPAAPVVLQFSTPVQAASGTLADAFRIEDDAGLPVTFTASATNGGRGIYLLAAAPGLRENTRYHVSWSGLNAADGAVQPVPLSFTTRPANQGPDSLTSSDSTFRVERALPVQTSFPFMDFSTVRLQFTQPVDTRSLVYGGSVRLEDGSGALVPARVLANRQLLTIDPVNDLQPGQPYTLKLTPDLLSTQGQALMPGSYASLALRPKNSAPRETIALEVPSTAVASPLTGKIINNVPITSRLLGNDSASQQGGNLYAELAFVPNYPEATPLRVPRGNLLNGSSVDVQIVGRVPAGLNTGAISVSIVSDATGYMTANPYSTAVDAPRLVYLTMDAAMSSSTSSANGAFNQNLLHIDLVGTAIVKNGRLVMDAVGVAELEVLGLDQAAGVLSFHLEGYADQTLAPAKPADLTPPALQSWLPGNESLRTRPGDPVILTFTEPLDPQSVTSNSVLLSKDGVSAAVDLRTDGSSVVIRPQQPLAHNADYRVQLSADVTDLAGNPVTPLSLDFRLPDLASPGSRSPVVLASYPGYPCVTSGRNVAANQQGRCVGGKAGDDILPLPTLPTERLIQVQFTQSLNPASVQLGTACASGSFRVERMSAGGSCLGAVPGRLEVSSQSLRFVPNQPWTAGELYRYMLVSNGNSQSSVATCDGSQAICGSNGLPLQTQALSQTPASAPTATGGGTPMEIWFRGGNAADTVLQRLRGLPATDVNANFEHDTGEAGAVDTGGGVFAARNGGRIITTGQSGLVTDSNIGCPVGSTCPGQQFLYLSSTLDAEVAGYDETAGGVRVLIQPTQLIASSVTVYATSSFGNIVSPTGLQVMRARYAVNPANGQRELPITAYIKDNGGQPQLMATLDLYLDLPALAPSLIGIPINHDLYSYPLTVAVSGPVQFLPDGRMLAVLKNTADVNLTVSLSAATVLPGGTISLRIPAGTLQMEGVSAPIKQ